MRYIYEQPDWPEFHWNSDVLEKELAAVRHQQGRLIGKMENLGFPHKDEAILQTLTQDVTQSSEIEGEILDREQVRSSIARRLGMDIAGLIPADRDVEGVVEMMLDATRNYRKPLTKDRLFDWHASLFPTGRSGITKINVGNWRDDKAGPMEVVSGPIGMEKVHYQAPDASVLEKSMQSFLDWFNEKENIEPVLKAAIAHLWFVTLHPFEDGNGRMARAIADMALARSEASPDRFYSMSAQIRQERNTYYDILEETQKRNLDITPWLIWFLNCLQNAIKGADNTLSGVLNRAAFWENYKETQLNPRQKDMINRLLDDFEGKLTTSKWAKIQKCSQDSALRDITDLLSKGILKKDEGGGRSSSYSLKE